ncbi:fluoride efflux transporter CrcB [Tepidibacillus marianensis]|uniref:fluoride efflux transporter CrcB n=1 Tax=Tepidibacillus marianensis TaxID=3131995 RepID=UPI0030D496D4
MPSSVFVALGGFFGAMARYGLGKWISRRTKSSFPVGTFTINLLGSFLLGLIFGSQFDVGTTLLLGTGFMGAFTTFSTFKIENLHLHRNKYRRTMFWYLGLSYVLGVFLAFLGFVIGGLIR